MTEEEKKAFDGSPLTGSIQAIDEGQFERDIAGSPTESEATRGPHDVELAGELKDRLAVVDRLVEDLNNGIDDLSTTLKNMISKRRQYERSGDILRAALNAAKADPKFVDGE